MSFFDDVWNSNKDALTNAAASQLSNIGSQLVTNQINSFFKIGKSDNATIAAQPQVVQVQSSNDMTMYYWIGGGVAALLVLVLVLRK